MHYYHQNKLLSEEELLHEPQKSKVILKENRNKAKNKLTTLFTFLNFNK